MTNGKQLSINFIIQILAFGVNLCISFFLTPFVIEYIGKDVYGFASLATQFTSYASMFTVALNGMLSRYVTIAVSKKEYKTAGIYMSSVLLANIVVMTLLTPISILFICNLERFLNLPIGFEHDIKLLFLFVFLGFLLNLPGSVCNSATYAVNRLDKSNACNLICSIIRIVLLLFLLFNFVPHVWYVGFSSFVYTIVMILANIIFKKQLLPTVHISIRMFEWEKVKELLSVGMWNTVNQLSQILLTGLDLVIANVFVSVSAMNLLSYGKMLPSQLILLISMTAGVFGPMLTLSYGRGELSRFVRETNISLKLCGFICAIPVLGILVFGQDFYKLWLASLPDADIRMVYVLTVLSILPQFFSVYIYPLYTINTITTKLKIPVLVTLGMGIANVLIVMVMVNYTQLGVYAVAGVSSLLALGNILVFVPLYAAHSIGQSLLIFYKPLLRGIMNNVVVTGLFVASKNISRINSWSSFIIICGISGVFGYALSFLLLFSKEEKKYFVDYLRHRFGGNKD